MYDIDLPRRSARSLKDTSDAVEGLNELARTYRFWPIYAKWNWLE